MSTSRKSDKTETYHHGDLRNTLIQLGTAMLIESGEAALSLRKLAQAAGVSHNAPYQHFADKNALIAAIVEDGFRLLGEAIEAELETVPEATPETRLSAVGRAYVRFGLTHASHLQLMFGSFPNSDYPDVAGRAMQTLHQLIAIVQDIQAQGGLKAASAEDAALVVWMTVHGLSAVLIAGKMPEAVQQGRSPDMLAERFVQMICQGLLK